VPDPAGRPQGSDPGPRPGLDRARPAAGRPPEGVPRGFHAGPERAERPP